MNKTAGWCLHALPHYTLKLFASKTSVDIGKVELLLTRANLLLYTRILQLSFYI